MARTRSSEVIDFKRFEVTHPVGQRDDSMESDENEPISSDEFDDDDAWEELEPDSSDLDRCDDWALDEDDELFDPDEADFWPDADFTSDIEDQ